MKKKKKDIKAVHVLSPPKIVKIQLGNVTQHLSSSQCWMTLFVINITVACSHFRHSNLFLTPSWLAVHIISGIKKKQIDKILRIRVPFFTDNRSNKVHFNLPKYKIYFLTAGNIGNNSMLIPQELIGSSFYLLKESTWKSLGQAKIFHKRYT